MQDPTIQIIEKDSKIKLSIELVNGYYLSFMSIGLLLIILRNDITPDLKQALFFVLMILISGTLRFFMRAASKEDNIDENKQYPQTIVNGNYYYNNKRVGDEVYNTSNQNVADIKMDTPSNYFDVLKAIEVVPSSPEPNKPGIRDVLTQLQSYVESDSTLLVTEKVEILELIRRMAIQAKSDPINNDLISVVESIQKIDRNSDFKARIVQALKDGAATALEAPLVHSPITILMAAIKLWMEETKKA